MAFEPGNQLAAKRKMLEGVLRRAVAQDNADRLRRACERLLDSAADGETWVERMAAFNVLADRLDGKAVARIETDQGDTRALSMADVARLILEHRASSATDATPAASHAERAALPSAAGGAGEGDIPVDQSEAGGG